MQFEQGKSFIKSTIPLCVPEINGNEWTYVKECIDTNWVSYLGPFVDRFENELSTKVQSRYAVATNSGTAALHISLLLSGVGRDDEVILPGISFVGPANAVRYCGAWPVFVDISENDWQLDVNKLSDFLSKCCSIRKGELYNRFTNRRIAAILPVHILGGMCDIDAVAEIAEKNNLPIVEDAAECLGARYKGRAIGAPLVGSDPPMRLVITSFNGNKIVTTGGGGAIFTENEALSAKAKHLSTTAKTDKIEFLHDDVAYNYRLTNIAAAIGVAQLERLDEFVMLKRSIARHYSDFFLSNDNITPHQEPPYCESTFWMYTVLLDRNSKNIIRKLNNENIVVRPIWIPLFNLPAFKYHCYSYNCEFAEVFYRNSISIPCSVGIKKDQIDIVGAKLSSLCN